MTATITFNPKTNITEGTLVTLTAAPSTPKQGIYTYAWKLSAGVLTDPPAMQNSNVVHWDTTNLRPGAYTVQVTVNEPSPPLPPAFSEDGNVSIDVFPRPLSRGDELPVTLRRSATQATIDQPLWVAIRNRTKAIAFNHYRSFIEAVLCETPPSVPGGPPRSPAPAQSRILARQRNQYGQVELDPINHLGTYTRIAAGVGAYDLLKTATEVFLLLNTGIAIREGYEQADEATRLGESVSVDEIRRRLQTYLHGGQLPYLERVIKAAFPGMLPNDQVHCDEVLISSRVNMPCLLELIWSYWHEEGMLVQSLNAISLRFQNRYRGNGKDPLAHLEIDPIRPLNNILWGYIQDEQQRLTVQRRAYEYDHHYGITLYGRAVPPLKSADSRSKFLEAYHNLLHLCTIFYSEDDDTTRIADAFPVLNALKETHLLLAQGAHNQFGDLPWTARAEMLMQQWILARRETRDFLQSRPMVPYQEDWMAQVDTMKKLQGWSDVTVTHFHDLSAYGEQLLLSIRYGDWIDVTNPAQAANWARYWRPEIQSYIHAYRAVTGVDLTAGQVDYTMPAALLRNRLAGQVRAR
jgi:hypothetical protein